MRRIRGIGLYLGIALPFLVLPALLVAGGVPGDISLSVAILAAIAAGIVATFVVRRLYLESTKPRSIFWGMLVSALEVNVAFGAWIGYLVTAAVLARVGYELPLPPQPVRQFLTSVAAIVLLITPVYYLATIALERSAEPAPPEPAEETV